LFLKGQRRRGWRVNVGAAGAAEWGPDAFLWRLDPAALPADLSERARHALATPRSTFSALCQANGAKVLAPSDDYVKTLQDLYAAAEAAGEAKAGWLPAYDLVVAESELCKQPRAAWLPPYKLEVAPGIFVTLRDKAIRDPFDGATRVVTVRVSASA
jgi:hypothetical protein